MRHKLHNDQQPKEPDLMPVMNLVCLLIPFLLLTATFVHFATINVNSPRFVPSRGDPDPAAQPLNLTVMVTDKGFTLSQKGAVISTTAAVDASAGAGPTIPVTGSSSGYDYEKLTSMVREIKDVHGDETHIMVGAERNIDYETIVQVMDATREDDQGELFPSVTMLGGVM